jgi:XYPPX repeat (two copies)
MPPYPAQGGGFPGGAPPPGGFGFSPQMYPQQAVGPYPYPAAGAPPGYPPQGYPPQGFPPQGYAPQGYPPQGFPPQGYPPQAQGYPQQGYAPPPGAAPYPGAGAPEGYAAQQQYAVGGAPQAAPVPVQAVAVKKVKQKSAKKHSAFSIFGRFVCDFAFAASLNLTNSPWGGSSVNMIMTTIIN